MNIKKYIKKILVLFHLDITKNMVYDRLTKKIIKTSLNKDSNCLDVGCHKGEILDLMLKYAPNGKHFGFEPIPGLYKNLVSKYKDKATIYPYALSNEEKTISFHLVENNPAYSGLKQRDYDFKNPRIKKIKVETRKIDHIIPDNIKIDFIKIDVEGGEFDVLKGAQQLIKQNHPLILFESGLGASEFYGTQPKDLFVFLENMEMNIYTLKDFVKKRNFLKMDDFVDIYENRKEYYFLAVHNKI